MIDAVKIVKIAKLISENRELMHDLADAICDVISKHQAKQLSCEKVSVQNKEISNIVPEQVFSEKTEDNNKTVVKKVEKKKSKSKRKTIDFYGKRLKYDISSIQDAADIAMSSKDLTQAEIVSYVAKYTGIPIPYAAYVNHIDFRDYKFANKRTIARNKCVVAKCLQKLNLPVNYIKALSGFYVDRCHIYKLWSKGNAVNKQNIKEVYNEYKLYLDNFDKVNPGVLDLSQTKIYQRHNDEKSQQVEDTKLESEAIGPLTDVYEPKKEEPEPVKMHLNEYAVLVPWPGMKPNKKNTIVPEKKQSESKMIMKEDAPKRKRSKKFTLDMITRDLVEKMVGTYCNRRDKYYFKDNFAVKDAMKADGVPHMQSWIANAIIFGHKYLNEDFRSIQTPGYVLARCPTAETDIKYISKIRWLRNHGKTLNEVLDIMKGEDRDNVSKVYYEGIYPGFCQVSIEDERAYNYKYFGIIPN